MPSKDAATYRSIPNNTADSWWKDPGLRRNVYHCAGICLAPFYQGYDSSLLTGLQAIPQWNKYFGSPSGTKLGLVTAAISFPGLFVSFGGAYIGNRWGRLWCLRVAGTFMIAGALLTTFAQNLGQFAGGRALMGVGIAMIKSVAIALIQEIAHPRLRPTLSTMYYGYFYTGSITAAWLTVAGLHIEGDWSWKFPCLAQLIGPVLSIIALVTCPESPRYYGKQGQVEKAHDFLAKYHANGTRDDPLVLFELAEIEAIIKEEEAAARSSYLDFFRTRGNLRRLRVIAMLGIGSNIVGNGIVAYYLSPVLKSVGITSATSITCINGGLAIWNLIFAWTAAVFSDRVGRRSLFLASMAGMFISYVFILSLSAGFASTAKAAVGAAVIPFLFFFYASYDIAWTALQWAYVSEVVTYTLRVKGAAIMNLLLSIGNAVSQFVNPIALAALTWKYYFVFLTIQAVYFVMFWYWLPETKGLSLEETTVLLDHDDYRHARAAVRDELTAKVEQVGLGEHHGLQDAKPEHIQIEKA